MASFSCFTAGDIRGRVPVEFSGAIAARIICAFAEQIEARKIVLGHDMRLSSPAILAAVVSALVDMGVDVENIGLCGTEEVYYAVSAGESRGIDGGVMITASHNPADYNGMKLVSRGARPVFMGNGLELIKQRSEDDAWWQGIAGSKYNQGRVVDAVDKSEYINHLLSFVDPSTLSPMTVVINSGNGCAGAVLDLLAPHLPFSFVRLQHEPDGTFPHGVPNPLLPENRGKTSEMVVDSKADLGIAWDGDFDRCFFYDEKGRFIDGYYIVALLAEAMLARCPGSIILHDPRLIWNTRKVVMQAGGKPVMTRTGHAFIKEKMRELDGLYGGEMSAHHYFRDFAYCDSGMIPWLLLCSLLSAKKQPLSVLVEEMIRDFPISGEINSRVSDPDKIMAEVAEKYRGGKVDDMDGLSVEFSDWRFNLRKSNTEPLLRLNVESRGDRRLMEEKTAEILSLIKS